MWLRSSDNTNSHVLLPPRSSLSFVLVFCFWIQMSTADQQHSGMFPSHSHALVHWAVSSSVTASHIPNTWWHRQSPTSRPPAIQWPFMIYEQATIIRALEHDMVKTISCSWGLCNKNNHLCCCTTIMVRTTTPQTKKGKYEQSMELKKEDHFRNAQYM